MKIEKLIESLGRKGEVSRKVAYSGSEQREDEEKEMVECYEVDEKKYPLSVSVIMVEKVIVLLRRSRNGYEAMVIRESEVGQSLRSIGRLVGELLREIKENGMEELFEEVGVKV